MLKYKTILSVILSCFLLVACDDNAGKTDAKNTNNDTSISITENLIEDSVSNAEESFQEGNEKINEDIDEIEKDVEDTKEDVKNKIDSSRKNNVQLSTSMNAIVRKLDVPSFWKKDGTVHELESKIGDKTLVAYAQTWNIPGDRLLEKVELKKILDTNRDIFDNVENVRESRDSKIAGNEILVTVTYRGEKYDLVLFSVSRGKQYKAEIALTHENQYLEHIGEDKFK